MNILMNYLELVLGPMFSGKTTKLIELYNHIKLNPICNDYNSDKDYTLNVIVINHIFDRKKKN